MKRADTERRLAAIAYDLVRERGFPHVTVDDIVEVAVVSRRTFSNYFSCKEEAVAAVILHQAAEGLATWKPTETDGKLIDLVRDMFRHQTEAGVLTRLVEVARLASTHRQFAPYVREAQWRLWSMAGERLPHPAEHADPLRRAELDAVLGAVFGVVSAHLARSLPAGSVAPLDPGSLRELVEHVLGLFDPGRVALEFGVQR